MQNEKQPFDIPDYVGNIGKGAFRSCSGLSSVTIPSSVTSIGDRRIDAVGIYTLDGKRVSAPQKGVNIIRYSDGTVKKTFLK